MLENYSIALEEKIEFKKIKKPYTYLMPFCWDMWKATALLGVRLLLSELIEHEYIKRHDIKGGGQYKNQIRLINSLFYENINSVSEYHAFISNNTELIENNLNDLISSFDSYLNRYMTSFVGLKTACGLDLKTRIIFNNVFLFFKPVIRFLDNYKVKCMSKILNFSKFVNYLDKKEFKPFLSIPEIRELNSLLDMPCLFLTITMGVDSPLKTVLKYKHNWKRFYNNLKHLSVKYGFNLDYFIKGVEFTKKNRLHVHFLILGVDMPINKLIAFKKDFENLLNMASFGYINDITYLKDKKTYIMKSKSDLKYYYSSDKYKNIKILDKFKIKYDNDKYASFNLVELEYINNTTYKQNKSSKIINYVLKYILKSNSYDSIKDNLQKRSFLKNNLYFWLTGIKKFNISRKLSKLLTVFNNLITDKRYLFFDSVDDAKNYIEKNKECKASFERLFMSDDVCSLEYSIYPISMSDLYAFLNLETTEFMHSYRFKSYILDYLINRG